MADNSKIEWTDATWNPITGCSVFSPGCTNCYAMRLAGTRLKHHPSRKGLTQDTKAGPVWTGEVRFNEAWLDQPLRWKTPHRIFVVAHGDLFAEAVPDEWIDRVFAVMALAPQHTFQCLTKRAARMREYLSALEARGAGLCRATHRLIQGDPGEAPPWPLPNVWLGVSVEDQARADERIPELLATPTAKRFISAEPLLGEIEVLDWLTGPGFAGIDWVIAGGESGTGARPMRPDWARSLRDQCQAAGVPFFFKQWGAWLPGENLGWPLARWQDGVHGSHQSIDHEWRHFTTPGEYGAFAINIGKRAAGRLLDGRTWDGFP